MHKIILIDNRVPNAERLAANTSRDDLVSRLDQYTSLTTTVSDIVAAWRSRMSARANGLYIAAHGQPGHMQLGMEGLSAGNVSLLAPLRAVAGRHVLLWGCNVAAAQLVGRNIIDGDVGSFDPGSTGEAIRRFGAGYNLLHAIARTLGLPTLGGINTQWVQANWHLVGTYVVVQPNGSYALSDGTLG